jgi:hypothetical protein
MSQGLLRRSGSSTSKRRTILLIGSRPLNGEGDTLDREEWQGILRHEHLPARPTFEGKSPGQAAQGSSLRLGAREADEDHDVSVTPTPGRYRVFLAEYLEIDVERLLSSVPGLNSA